MGKNRNTAKKAEKRQARLASKKRTRVAVIIVISVLLLLFGVLLIFSGIEKDVTFVKKNGGYTDPSTGKIYYAADISAYEIRTEFYEKDYYGKMDGDKVYTIPGVKNEEWLVRCLESDLYELYYEESVALPEISDFEASELYLFVDAPVILSRETVKGEDLDKVVDLLTGGTDAGKPTAIETDRYSIRLVSEKYEHFYYCCRLIVTDSGSYLYDYPSGAYIDCGEILDGYVESLKEALGE